MPNPYAILVAASMPPPLAGQSVATTMLLRGLQQAGIEHKVLSLSRPFYTKHRDFRRVSRIIRLGTLPARAMVYEHQLDINPLLFYLQLGQSHASLARDLPLLWLASIRRWPLIVHVHGAGFRTAFETLPSWAQDVVSRALAPARRAIVLSNSLRGMLSGLVPQDRICTIGNGVDTPLSHRATQRKIPESKTLNVLYLSNLIESKGYIDVLRAAVLAQEMQLPIHFHLAGASTEETPVHPRGHIKKHNLTKRPVSP